MITEDGEQRHGTIAEGDTLEDGPDAEMGETEQVALDGVVEPVDKESDGEEQYRALHDAADDLRCGLELRLHQGEVARDSHDKEEEGEHQIAGRHAIPLGVLEHLERLAPAIVDEDHACHRDTAQDV